jgi:hypothetical protein
MKTNNAIRCKSFTLPGGNGYNLMVSETVGRQEIEVSITRQCEGNQNHLEVATVRISGPQFELLCRMDASYDGLEVRKPVDAEDQTITPPAVPRQAEEMDL